MGSPKKSANSQAGWALISGGVNAARVETHRLRHMLHKVLKLVESSKKKEHLYQVAGDLIIGIPRRLDALENQLDELGYALSIMGEDHLKDRLPLSRRILVEEAVEGSGPFKGQVLKDSVQRVLKRHLAKRGQRA